MSSDTFKSNQLWYYMPDGTPFALLQVHFVWYLCSRYILSQLWTKRHAPHKLNEHWIPQWVGQITNYKLQISNYKRTSLPTRSMRTWFLPSSELFDHFSDDDFLQVRCPVCRHTFTTYAQVVDIISPLSIWHYYQACIFNRACKITFSSSWSGYPRTNNILSTQPTLLTEWR